ncbi:MAG: hypothetical protein ACR2OZ_18310 [Verrucomicrobiales bacterium]
MNTSLLLIATLGSAALFESARGEDQAPRPTQPPPAGLPRLQGDAGPATVQAVQAPAFGPKAIQVAGGQLAQPVAQAGQSPPALPSPGPLPPRVASPPPPVQQLAPPPPPRTIRATPGAGLPHPLGTREEESLKSNYSVKLTVAQGAEKRECSIVTASSSIRFSAVLGDPPMVPIQFSGNLTEHENGTVTLTYAVEARISPREPKAPGQEHSESASGQLRVTLGLTYPVYNSGERTYSLSVQAY